MRPYTNLQEELWKSTTEDRINRISYIDNIIKQLEEAVVKLPYTNEKGQGVTHGCNMTMLNLLDMYKQEKNLLRID